MGLREFVSSLSSEQIVTLKKLLIARDNEHLSADADEYAVNNYACPHCGHRKFCKNGRVRGSQRFKCHGCSKTFGLKTNTLFHATRKPLQLWSQYIDLLFEQKSIREIAQELEIAITTAFFWRHKILAALRAIVRHKKPLLEGVVEADETYTLLSFKGQKSGIPRLSKKRGTPATQRGISKEQVCILAATDRRKNSRMKAVCLGRPKTEHITLHLEGMMSQASCLVTDKHRSYEGFCKKKGIPHEHVSSSREVKGSVHIQNVNSLHSHLKACLRPYRGVATKYLDNYIALFEWKRRSNLPAIGYVMQVLPWMSYEKLRLGKMTLT